MEIKGKTFFVTGGASGLGLATASRLLDEGANVSIFDLKPPSERPAEIGRLMFHCGDICNEESVKLGLEATISFFGKIDGLINCAGIGLAKRVVGKDGPHSLELFAKVVQINLIGTFNIIRLAVHEMQHNPEGSSGERGIVINTASIAAFEGQIGQAAYAASKGGIVAMTLPLAREFSKMGIRVVTIAPGIFETPLLDALPPEAQASLGAQIPFPARLGKPEEFAGLCVHVIQNQMLNGETIRLDGAMRMGSK